MTEQITADQIECDKSDYVARVMVDGTWYVQERTCHDLHVFDSWDMFTCSSCKALILRNAVHFSMDGFTDNSLRFCPWCGARIEDE